MILILIAGYVCHSTITGGSSQHSAVALFSLYIAASEAWSLGCGLDQCSSNGELYSFLLSFGIVCDAHSKLCITFVIAGNFDEIITRSGLIQGTSGARSPI